MTATTSGRALSSLIAAIVSPPAILLPSTDRAVEEVTGAARGLVDSLVTNAPPRDRQEVAEQARAVVADGLSNLRLGVHHEGPVAHATGSAMGSPDITRHTGVRARMEPDRVAATVEHRVVRRLGAVQVHGPSKNDHGRRVTLGDVKLDAVIGLEDDVRPGSALL
jgi:hypothetical protein